MCAKILADEREKNLFLKTLNKKGFILEERTQAVFSKLFGAHQVKSNIVYDHFGRVEIDALVELNDRNFIGECKKTDYTWIFPKEVKSDNRITLIHYTKDGIRFSQRSTADFECVKSDIAVVFEYDKLKMTNSTDVQSSTKDIHDAIRQVLNETEAVIRFTNFKGKIFFPIIVTNADLYIFDYNPKGIDRKGNIMKCLPLRPVNMIAYNFPQEMYWKFYSATSGETRMPIRNIRGEIGDNMKTIFITNIEHLSELAHKLEDQEVTGVVSANSA